MSKSKKMLKEIMDSNPVTLDTEMSVMEGAKQMRDHDIGSVLVTKRDELFGIVTDRDLTLRCLAEGKDAKVVRLGELCSKQPTTLPEDAPVSDATRLMAEQGIRRIPVVKGNKAVGVVSLGDLALSEDRGSALGQISAAQPNNVA